MIAVVVIPFVIVGVLASIGVAIAVIVMTFGAAIMNPRFGLALIATIWLYYWIWHWGTS